MESTPYTAPARSSFWQKLGPGGFVSLAMALVSGLTLVPVLLRLREVLDRVEGDAPHAADAILVLGRKLKGDDLTEVFEARLAHAEGLWRAGLAPRIIVAGGLTGTASRSEAEAGVAWLTARGFDPESLHAEDKSQHTLENLFYVRDLMNARGWRELLIVSDPLHLARAGAMARGLNLQVRCSPAVDAPPTRGSRGWVGRACFEAFYLHWYHLGVAYSRFIGSRKQLERVT
ncbi:MAG TPA: YdcF family protein [Holophagaceae bacterium]|nr:YdcF family protein [Holophagaceae bacterium]